MRVLCLVPQSRFSKNVARDLLYGCWCRGKRIAGTRFPPISLVSVATLLRDAGCEALIEEGAPSSANFDSVVVLTSSATINEDSAILASLKSQNPRLRTIAFGAHPTFMPHATLEKTGIDIIVRHEPEFALRDLILKLQAQDEAWKEVKGIGYKEDGGIEVNEPYPFIEDLDILPIPDRKMLNQGVRYFNPVVKRLPYTTMMTSRGCPGRCSFCSSPSFYGRTIRYQSAARVIAELEEVVHLGYREVFFRDEIFTVSPKRTMEICESILRNGLDISWICSARIGSVDKETMRLMKRAGCHMIRFGVESGSQRILDNIQKGITVTDIIETFKWAREAKIDTHAHLMLGSPGETYETLVETADLIHKIKPTTLTMGICTPYPGTGLFEKVLKRHTDLGDGSDCDISRLHTQGYYNEEFCDLYSKVLNRALKTFYRKFYLNPPYILRTLSRVRGFSELWRMALAGLQVADFSFYGD